MSLQENLQRDKVTVNRPTPPPESIMTRNLKKIVQRPDEEFRFTLESINSAFGISADTLKAIAESYGVLPEPIIVRALTEWAKIEVPGLDSDEPLLSEVQLKALRLRRLRIDKERNDKRNRPSLLDQYKEYSRVDGETDGGKPEELGTLNGEPD
jgi:hypothetical protein